MNQTCSKKLKTVRNILIFGGIIVGFLIWLAVPSILKNSVLNLATDDSYGSKYLLLPSLSLPLFAFLDGKKRQDIYSEDEEERARIIEETETIIARDQIIYAIVEDCIVIVFMVIALFL